MPDDSQEMPEFDKPENIPLVVPDLPPVKRRCIEKNKLGNPCRVPPIHGQERCLGHSKQLDPELRRKWSAKRSLPSITRRRLKTGIVRSKNEILAILSQRLDLMLEKWGKISDPNIDERICDICRTMAAVHKIDAAEDAEAKGWRLKGAV